MGGIVFGEDSKFSTSGVEDMSESRIVRMRFQVCLFILTERVCLQPHKAVYRSG